MAVEEFELTSQQGTLNVGPLRASYTTSQPAPMQWVAVGVVQMPGGSEPPVGSQPTHRMLVGTGQTERAAVSGLAGRLAQLAVQTDGGRHP